MITTGKTIYDLLKASTALTALVGTKIYPIVLPEDLQLPCVVYQRSFVNQKTKDGQAVSNSTITLTVLAVKYTDGINIATACHNALKLEANLLSGDEDYANGVYAQVLTFEFWGV